MAYEHVWAGSKCARERPLPSSSAPIHPIGNTQTSFEFPVSSFSFPVSHSGFDAHRATPRSESLIAAARPRRGRSWLAPGFTPGAVRGAVDARFDARRCWGGHVDLRSTRGMEPAHYMKSFRWNRSPHQNRRLEPAHDINAGGRNPRTTSSRVGIGRRLGRWLVPGLSPWRP